MRDGRPVTRRGETPQSGAPHVADGLALEAKAYWVVVIALVLFIASAFSYRSSRA